MTSTVTITKVHEDITVREKVEEPGKFLFFSWSGEVDKRYRIYELKILLPNGETKIVELQ